MQGNCQFPFDIKMQTDYQNTITSIYIQSEGNQGNGRKSQLFFSHVLTERNGNLKIVPSIWSGLKSII